MFSIHPKTAQSMWKSVFSKQYKEVFLQVWNQYNGTEFFVFWSVCVHCFFICFSQYVWPGFWFVKKKVKFEGWNKKVAYNICDKHAFFLQIYSHAWKWNFNKKIKKKKKKNEPNIKRKHFPSYNFQ